MFVILVAVLVALGDACLPGERVVIQGTYCRFYEECVNGGFIVRSCPYGSIFDTKRHECLPIMQAMCSNGLCKNGETLTHPKSDKLFYSCEDGQMRLKLCSTSSGFGVENGACAKLQIVCADGETIPGNDGSSYAVCRGGVWMEGVCEGSKRFDAKQGFCVDENDDAIRRQDESNHLSLRRKKRSIFSRLCVDQPTTQTPLPSTAESTTQPPQPSTTEATTQPPLPATTETATGQTAEDVTIITAVTAYTATSPTTAQTGIPTSTDDSGTVTSATSTPERPGTVTDSTHDTTPSITGSDDTSTVTTSGTIVTEVPTITAATVEPGNTSGTVPTITAATIEPENTSGTVPTITAATVEPENTSGTAAS